MKPALLDADDLWCEQQIIELLLPLREAVGEHFRFTAYAIPNRLGPVHQLRRTYPWLTFAIHGFEHSFAECLSWHSELATARLERALDMGYDPVFKAPNWLCDIETETACKQLGVILHHHKTTYEPATPGLFTYPGPRKKRWQATEHDNFHTHLLRNPVTDFITDHRDFEPERLKAVGQFLAIPEVAVEV